MAHLNKNLNNGSGLRLIPKYFWISLVIAIVTAFLKIVTFNLNDKTNYEPLSNLLNFVVGVSNWFLIISSSIVIAFAIWIYVREVLFYFTEDPIYLMVNRRLDYFLQTVGIYLKYNKDKVLIPKVRKVNDENIKAFEIEIIGDKKEKLLSLNSSLNSYLSQKYAEYKIIESYEKDGWVRYILAPDYLADQLDGDSIEL